MFPLHDPDVLEHLRLHWAKPWAGIGKRWLRHPFYQDIDTVRDYFGVHIAFYFEWLGFLASRAAMLSARSSSSYPLSTDTREGVVWYCGGASTTSSARTSANRRFHARSRWLQVPLENRQRRGFAELSPLLFFLLYVRPYLGVRCGSGRATEAWKRRWHSTPRPARASPFGALPPKDFANPRSSSRVRRGSAKFVLNIQPCEILSRKKRPLQLRNHAS